MVCCVSTCLCIAAVILIIIYKLIDYVVRLPRMGSKDQRYVLITGCDSGFGFEAAKRLDKDGCHVFATCLTERGETEIKKCCSSRLKAIHMDVSDTKSVKKGFEFVKSSLPFGKGLWGVVNNAGRACSACGPCEMLTLDNYRECYEVNLIGVVDVTMTFLPLVKLERGRIVNTTSIGGRVAGMHFHAAYHASKFALEAFSDVLRRNMVWYGITVHIVEPMAHATSMALLAVKEAEIRKAWRQASPELKKQFDLDYENKLLELWSTLLGKQVSASLDGVVDAYHHALFARVPRARYQVGRGAQILLFIQWLPEFISDRILTAIVNPPKPVSAYTK